MATAAAAGLAFDAPGGPAMLKRLASAAVLLPIFLLIVLKAPAALFSALVVFASAAGLWELVRMLEHAGRPVARWLALGAGTAVTAAFASPQLEPLTVPTFTLL